MYMYYIVIKVYQLMMVFVFCEVEALKTQWVAAYWVVLKMAAAF